MSRIQVKNPVEFRGKQSYSITTDIMPMPDGSGILFRDGSLVNAEGRIPCTLVPWTNIVAVSTDVDPSFFEPAPEDSDEPTA